MWILKIYCMIMTGLGLISSLKEGYNQDNLSYGVIGTIAYLPTLIYLIIN